MLSGIQWPDLNSAVVSQVMNIRVLNTVPAVFLLWTVGHSCCFFLRAVT